MDALPASSGLPQRHRSIAGKKAGIGYAAYGLYVNIAEALVARLTFRRTQ